MAHTRHAVFAASSRFPFGRVAGAACLLALTAVGCRTTQNANSSLNGTRGALGSAAKTDFNPEATADQGFNMHTELARVRASESNFEAAVSENLLALEISEKKGSRLSGAKLGPEKQALAHRRSAESLDQLGRFAEADVHYSKALKLSPKDPKVWNSAGYSYYIQHRLSDAERCLKMASTFDPNDPKIQTNLGLTLAAAGKTDDALSALTKAGGPAVAQANLGFILAALGKKEEAKKHYETAIALQPELAPARLALAHLDTGTKDAAVSIASTSTPIPTPAPISAPLPDALRAGVPASRTAAPATIPVPVPIAVGAPLPVSIIATSPHGPIPLPVPEETPAYEQSPAPAAKHYPVPTADGGETRRPVAKPSSRQKTKKTQAAKAAQTTKPVETYRKDPQVAPTSYSPGLIPSTRKPNTIPPTPW